MTDVLFRIYYDGGETFSGDPFEAPALGVLVIVERDPDSGRRLVSDKDYYVWDDLDSRWWSVDHIGMIDYLIRPGRKRVLFGRTIDSNKWFEVMRHANEDLDFPKRTSWGNKERVI